MQTRESEPQEIYHWINFSGAGDYEFQKLDKANIPYITNEYGTWIGRTDSGSAWDIYFLPMLLDALYN